MVGGPAAVADARPLRLRPPGGEAEERLICVRPRRLAHTARRAEVKQSKAKQSKQSKARQVSKQKKNKKSKTNKKALGGLNWKENNPPS